jgi:hypothetical protein
MAHVEGELLQREGTSSSMADLLARIDREAKESSDSPFSLDLTHREISILEQCFSPEVMKDPRSASLLNHIDSMDIRVQDKLKLLVRKATRIMKPDSATMEEIDLLEDISDYSAQEMVPRSNEISQSFPLPKTPRSVEELPLSRSASDSPQWLNLRPRTPLIKLRSEDLNAETQILEKNEYAELWEGQKVCRSISASIFNTMLV